MYSVIISQHLDCAFIYNISGSAQVWLWCILKNNPGSLCCKGTALRAMDPLKKICKHILATGQVLLCLTHIKLLPKYLTEEQMWGILSSNVVVTLDANSLQFVLFFLFLFLDLCCWMQKAFCEHYIWHLTLSNHKTLTSLSHCCCWCCCITFFVPWWFFFIFYMQLPESVVQFESSISFSLVPNK